MTRVTSITLAVVIAATCSVTAEADVRARTRSERARIIKQPTLESATATTAIIRFTANTAGGTAKHFGIVRYGTCPEQLDRTAMSPLKWSSASAPNVTYRIRIGGLAPHTTYYYVVDAAGAGGNAMRLKSRIRTFTTDALPAERTTPTRTAAW